MNGLAEAEDQKLFPLDVADRSLSEAADLLVPVLMAVRTVAAGVLPQETARYNSADNVFKTHSVTVE